MYCCPDIMLMQTDCNQWIFVTVASCFGLELSTSAHLSREAVSSQLTNQVRNNGAMFTVSAEQYSAVSQNIKRHFQPVIRHELSDFI